MYKRQDYLRAVVDAGGYAAHKGARAAAGLRAAARAGKLDEVRAIVAEHPLAANETDEKGLSALIIATLKGHSEIVDAILAVSPAVDVDAREKGGGRTALFLAAHAGHEAIARSICAKGADVDATNAKGQTPLWTAAANGHLGIARCLLAHGASSEIDTSGAAEKITQPCLLYTSPSPRD